MGEPCGAVFCDEIGNEYPKAECEGERGHEGPHFYTLDSKRCGDVKLTWTKDYRVNCSWCGVLTSDHGCCGVMGCRKPICWACAKDHHRPIFCEVLNHWSDWRVCPDHEKEPT